jgi:hypothetical protein
MSLNIVQPNWVTLSVAPAFAGANRLPLLGPNDTVGNLTSNRSSADNAQVFYKLF